MAKVVTPFLVFRGLGKWLNPLALEARDSRFKSGVPDQIFDNQLLAVSDRRSAISQNVCGER